MGARRILLLGALIAGFAVAALGGASSALAAGAWWHLDSGAAPSVLPSGGEGQVDASASNLGYEEILASEAHQVKITDIVPTGLEVIASKVRGYARLPHSPVSGRSVSGRGNTGSFTELKCEATGQTVSCFVKHPIYAYEGLEMVIPVKVNAPAGSKLPNEVKIEGGETEAFSAPLSETVEVGSGATPFGLQKYELKPENEEGKLDTQAGDHPFQLTTTLNLNQTVEANKAGHEEETAPALLRDLHFVLPPGFLGNVTVVPECTALQFATVESGDVNQCPPDTAVGVARIKLNEPVTFQGIDTETVPVFNLVPAEGEPAAFGIEIDKVPVVLNTAVRTGSDYAVEVSARNSTQAAALLQSQVTFWGVPGDPRHNEARGWECIGKGYWVETAEPARPCDKAFHPSEPKAFLSLPASCAANPVTTVTGDSWAAGEARTVGRLEGAKTSYELPARQGGCELLGFAPAIEVEPETHSASEPSGLTVKVSVPQDGTLSEKGPADADVKNTTLTLPEGELASPGAATGLESCSSSSIGLVPGFAESSQLENDHFEPGEAGCPKSTKIGTVAIKTPLLKKELLGSVYLARQDNNLLEERLVLYIAAYDPESGVRVKLAGDVHLDPSTGRLTSHFSDTPPVPFSQLTLKFFGGGRAAQSNPPLCGSYTTQASFAPSTERESASASSAFAINSGPGGSACPDPGSFTPSILVGSSNTQGGAYTHFSLTIAHNDADQSLQALTAHLPAGMAAMLSSVTPCQEPLIANNECGPESLIGHSTASSGLGGEPFTLGGRVYLTGPYKGAPFGLSVVTPAVAGPFNLGDVTVRSTINVDPTTAAVTITSDPFPTFVRGVPVQLKQINVTVDREGFQFNPTNCAPTAITGSLTGGRGAAASLSYPYEATNCASLPFAPKLTATTGGQASKPNGASLNVKIESTGLGQANIAKVDLTLPQALPSRLSTIQKACVAAVFNANPAACDEGSNIGYAIIHTPVLKSPLSGPAYLVSHGGAAFPDVEIVLQGEGITLILDGKTDIKKGITYSRFEAAPDAPFSTFETFLPTGPHSALAAYVAESKHYSLCGANLVMPTEVTAQNGAFFKQSTPIVASGCKGVASYKVTRAQRLSKALKACRKLKKKSKRMACEKKARKQYGPLKKTKKGSKKK